MKYLSVCLKVTLLRVCCLTCSSYRWYFAMISMSGAFSVTFSVIFAYVADVTDERERSTAYGLVRTPAWHVFKIVRMQIKHVLHVYTSEVWKCLYYKMCCNVDVKDSSSMQRHNWEPAAYADCWLSGLSRTTKLICRNLIIGRTFWIKGEYEWLRSSHVQ